MKQHTQGFSLVELIVVLAILGVISSIALPRMVSFQSAATTVAQNSVLEILTTNWQRMLTASAAAAYDLGANTKTIQFNGQYLVFQGGTNTATLSFPGGFGTTSAAAHTNFQAGGGLNANSCAELWNIIMPVNQNAGYGDRYTAGTVVDDALNCGPNLCDFVASYNVVSGVPVCAYDQVAQPSSSNTYRTTGYELLLSTHNGPSSQTVAPQSLSP